MIKEAYKNALRDDSLNINLERLDNALSTLNSIYNELEENLAESTKQKRLTYRYGKRMTYRYGSERRGLIALAN